MEFGLFQKSNRFILAAILSVFSIFSAKPTIIESGEVSAHLTQTDVVVGNHAYDILISDFNRKAEEDFIIPGLYEGLVPQGICYDANNGLYIMNGYYENAAAPSRVAIIDADGSFIKSVAVIGANGKASTGHFGGVAVFNDNVYITFSSNILVLSLSDILAAEDGGDVSAKATFKTEMNVSFCEVSGGVLWAGRFIENNQSVLDASDYKYSKCGERFYSRCDGFELDENAEYGFKAESISGDYVVPDKSVAIPNEIQGLTVLSDGRIVMTSSYGRQNHSFIYVYRNVFERGTSDTITVNGREIPFYYCSRAERTANYTAPHMLEELAELPDGRLCLVPESGANVYRHDGKNPLDHVIFWEA